MGNLNNIGELYRVIKRSRPDTIKRRNGKVVGISSALFKDECGVSVDQKKERSKDEAIDGLKKFFKQRLKGVASLFESDVADADAVLIEKPSDELPCHAEIHKSHDEILLDDEQALQLADSCNLILLDESIAWTNNLKECR